ncbi:MAG: hypothetical protein R2729_23400 [Bryobacteraceae bacterium]
MLRTFCESHGSASISDVARDAMKTFLGDEPAEVESSLVDQIRHLDRKVADLSATVGLIAETLKLDGAGLTMAAGKLNAPSLLSMAAK